MNAWLNRLVSPRKSLSPAAAPRRAERRGFEAEARRGHSDKTASTDGFALIDVLVGLAIAGVISSLMTVFLGQARTMMRIKQASDMQMEVDAATRFLETAIANAEPLPLSRSSPDNVIYFSGAADRLQFNGIQAIGFGSSALREIAIGIERASDQTTGDLSIAQKPRRGTADKVAENQQVQLIGGVTGLKFEYLDGVAGASTWSADWVAQRRLPSAVRFTISVARNGTTYSSQGFARLSLSSRQAQPAN